MASWYGRYFDPKQFGVPYDAPEEHLLDLVRWCELLLTAYTACYAPAPETPPPDPAAEGQAVLRDFDKARFHIDSRAESTARQGRFLAAQYLREVLRLTNLEWFGLLLWLLPAYDERFGPWLGQLRGNANLRQPGFDLTVKLFHFVAAAEAVPQYHQQRRSLEEKAEFALILALAQ